MEVVLTPEYLESLFIKQEFKCALTGIEICLPKNSYEKRHSLHTASLDRINNNEGYIEGNVQWVHKVVNIMRRSLTLEEFKYWCKQITVYNNL